MGGASPEVMGNPIPDLRGRMGVVGGGEPAAFVFVPFEDSYCIDYSRLSDRLLFSIMIHVL